MDPSGLEDKSPWQSFTGWLSETFMFAGKTPACRDAIERCNKEHGNLYSCLERGEDITGIGHGTHMTQTCGFNLPECREAGESILEWWGKVEPKGRPSRRTDTDRGGPLTPGPGEVIPDGPKYPLEPSPSNDIEVDLGGFIGVSKQ